jgi:hypothetical protein
MRLGLAAGRPALAAGLGLQVQRAELVEAEHDRLAGMRERVELDDPVALGLKVGIVGTLPGPHRLRATDRDLLLPLHAQVHRAGSEAIRIGMALG